MVDYSCRHPVHVLICALVSLREFVYPQLREAAQRVRDSDIG